MGLREWIALALGLGCCGGVALDAFQTIILPRRPKGKVRITRLFYALTWAPWVAMGERVKGRGGKEQFYSVYGPLSLILLLVLWAVLLILGFALLYFALGSKFADPLDGSGGVLARFRSDLYVSGTTLFTLGLGDVVPRAQLDRALLVLESGTGLGFVAMVIGYLPVLYQAFSRREVSVAMLDGRAGSPPTATELLRRHGHEGGEQELIVLLQEWERWAAELLESHVSYPILCVYRSQHDNQSWLGALVCILDACALLITTVEGRQVRQAQLTFAMARHALIDLGHVFGIERRAARWGELEARGIDRLPAATFGTLCATMGDMHLQLCGDAKSVKRLKAIRLLYEPHAHALSDYLKMPLPEWVAEPKKTDSWRTVADLRRSPELALHPEGHVTELSAAATLHDEEHGF